MITEVYAEIIFIIMIKDMSFTIVKPLLQQHVSPSFFFYHISFMYILSVLDVLSLCYIQNYNYIDYIQNYDVIIILGNIVSYFIEVKEIVEPSPDEVVEEFLQNRGPAEEPVEREKEKTDEEEYQELLDEEHALKLKEEELLAIGIAGWLTSGFMLSLVGQSVARMTQEPGVPGSILSFLLPLIQEGQLSVTDESLWTKYWLRT